MPFGISSAPEVWQQKMHEVVEGLSGVEVIADDFLVIGRGVTHEEATQDHDRNLRGFLRRSLERNLKLSLEKTKLRLTEVPFVGHKITSAGLIAHPEKVKAIQEMPTPSDVKALRRVLGMVNYLAKFLPQLSGTCEVLRQLERKNTEWCWLEQHERAWTDIKRLVTNAPILAFYDPHKELTLQCDASQSGLGAALIQEGRPVSFASRALSQSERQYAQIEKELLAIVFACERFDQYIYAKPTKVETDHKPLEVIAKKNLMDTPKRLQRMMLRLQRFDLQIVYKRGSEMYLADTLSRAYLPGTSDTPRQSEFCQYLEQVNAMEDWSTEDIKLTDIKQATTQDEELMGVAELVRNGWPKSRQDVPDSARPYHNSRHELSIQDGLIFKGDRVVIPTSLRSEMKKQIHRSHIGMEGCLRRARELMYWPGMNSDVRDLIAQCTVCATFRPEQTREPLQPQEIPDRPWSKVGVDLFELNDVNYVITVDYYSSFFEVDRLNDTRTSSVIHKLKNQFARHGIPDSVASDNGPQFSSREFQKFVKDWMFHHVTSSPKYPQSNGKVENAVKTCKTIMRKAVESHSDLYLALLDARNTPSEKVQASPSQLLFGRRTKTQLPTSRSLLKPVTIPPEQVTARLQSSKETQAKQYDRKAKVLPPPQPGDLIGMMRPGQTVLSPAVCVRSIAPRSYLVESGGKKYRRNRRQSSFGNHQEDHQPSPEVEDDDTNEEPGTPQPPPSTPVTHTTGSNPVAAEPQATQAVSGSAPYATARTPSARARRVGLPARFKDYDMS